MKYLVRFAVGAAVALAPPSVASASPVYVLSGMCSPGNQVCATARFGWDAAVPGKLTFDIWNGKSLSANASTFGRISSFTIGNMPTGISGIIGAGSVFFFDAGQAPLDISSYWDNSADSPLSNSGDLDFQTSAGPSDGVWTCTGSAGGQVWRTCTGSNDFNGLSSDYVRFIITLSGGTPANSNFLSGLVWAWKAKSVGPDGVSIECENASNNQQIQTCSAGSDPLGGGLGGLAVVAPEPATMSLLALGLAGMAAASRRRRKS